MRVLAIVGAYVLAAVTMVSAHSSTLAAQRPLTVRLLDTTVSEVVGFLARYSGVTIRFDDEVPTSVRNGPLREPLASASLAPGQAVRRAGQPYGFWTGESSGVAVNP